METKTENTVHTKDQIDKQRPWTFEPEPASPSNTTAAPVKKWQLVSLLIGILLILSIGASGWMFVDKLSVTIQRDRMQDENQSLREQLNIAGTQIAGYKNEIETLQSRSVEPAKEAANLTPRAATPATFATTQTAPAVTGRGEATRKVTYTKGTTRNEIISMLGEPDRIYKSRGYEQLVYFDKKPGRFWLVGDNVVQVGG